jgi:hypothetical protein
MDVAGIVQSVSVSGVASDITFSLSFSFNPKNGSSRTTEQQSNWEIKRLHQL